MARRFGEAFEALRDFLRSIDMTFPKGGNLRPSNFNQILTRARDTEHDHLVDRNRWFSEMLWGKGIPNHYEVWGGQFGHDWPWWREHLRRFV